MENFVHRQNLLRYVDILEHEPTGDRRLMVRRLLIEEEDRFGTVAQRLNEAEAHIAEAGIRIHRQQDLVARLKADGRDASAAEELLTHFLNIAELFEQHRSRLRTKLDESAF
jgi:hypothetical protein